jgi:hypothetical protein
MDDWSTVYPAILRGYKRRIARGEITIEQVPEPYKSAILAEQQGG